VPRLLLVRHGQASFYGPSYDVLSPLGEVQARRLGEHWAAAGLTPDRVYVGPRQRHAQTCRQVEQAYRDRGLAFPSPVPLPGLDEHHGIAVARAHLGHADPAGGAMAAQPHAGSEADKAAAMREFLDVLREWARGQIAVPGYETWEEFRARVLGALDHMCTAPEPGLSVAFTSGGVVSVAMAWILGLDADRTMDLHAVVRNASVTEVGYAGRRRRLVDFNSIAHLGTPGLVTLV